MIVQVNADVRIRAEDGNNYTIEKRYLGKAGKSKGKETWASIGFYGSLEHATNALLGRHLGLLVDQRSGKVSRRLRVKLNEVVEAIREESESLRLAIKAASNA